MPFIHDTLTELIEHHPEVLRQLCRWAGAHVPGSDSYLQSHRNELRLSITPEDSRLLKPDLYLLEWSANRVHRLPNAAILIETQASPNPRKPLTWDLYHLLVLLFHEVDPEILLVALGASMEANCRELAERVRVADVRLVGPSTLPRSLPEDVHVAATMVAILMDDAPRELAEHALRGLLTNLSDPHAADYYWMVAACLPLPMREELLMSMQDSYFTERERSLDIYKRAAAEGREAGREEGREAGREEGHEEGRKALIQAVITSLRNRGLESSSALVTELEQIHDHERLITIVGRAAVIESAAALLAELLAPA